MILVSGGSGALAKGIVEALRAGGVEPIVGTRAPSGGERRVDFDAPDTLDTAFEGVDTLVMVSAGYAEDDVVFARHRHAVEAAERAGVAHVVYTSLIGAGDHLSIATAHRYTERLLTKSSMDTTVLRNGLYAELFAADAGAALDSGELALPWGGGGLRPVARDDLAEAAANVAREVDAGRGGHAGRVYELDGTEYVDGGVLAAALSAASGREIPYRDLPLDALREALPQSGLLPYQVAHTVSIMSNIKGGLLDRDATDLPSLLGRAPRSALAVLAG
jgi:NAD(P)H dehydrogenase (quinone)